MHGVFILLMCVILVFTTKNAEAHDSFSFMQKGLPCGFVHTTKYNYVVDGAREYDTVIDKGGFVIVAGEYIVTNRHVAIRTPEDLKHFLFRQNMSIAQHISITQETRQLDFCDGVLVEMTNDAEEIASDADIDYAVYRFQNREIRSRSLQVPIWAEYAMSHKFIMAGYPGSMNLRTIYRSGYLTHLENQSPTRMDTSIMFNVGDSGHPIFTIHNNLLHVIGIGVEYKTATHRGRIIPLVLIVQDIKRKTKTDLLLLHKNFLESK